MRKYIFLLRFLIGEDPHSEARFASDRLAHPPHPRPVCIHRRLCLEGSLTFGMQLSDPRSGSPHWRGLSRGSSPTGRSAEVSCRRRSRNTLSGMHSIRVETRPDLRGPVLRDAAIRRERTRQSKKQHLDRWESLNVRRKRSDTALIFDLGIYGPPKK